MNSLKGKKILILGGNRLSCDIVYIAKKMGLYTIVTDWNSPEASPAKLIADESWNISLLDYNSLLIKIKGEDVDGILTGFTDSYLIPYAKLCKLSNLPSYATEELFEKTINKSLFKEMCRKHNLPVVPEYEVSSFNPNIISRDNKVIIKPVDNSGSRGIVICDNPSSFQECLNYSISYSKSQKVIIERYIEYDAISVSYTIQDGIPSLSTMNDDYLYKTPNFGAVNCGGIYPSKYLNHYLSFIDRKVKQMLIKEGFKNGVLFMQAFTNGQELFFFEMGYRLSGGRHYIFTENQNKLSSIKQLIYFAITGKMSNSIISKIDTPKFKNICFRLNLIGNQGKIYRIVGIERLSDIKEIINYSVLKREGEEVGKPGTTATQLLGAYIVANNKERIRSIVDFIYSNVSFLDVHGNNLVVKSHNFI